MAKGGKREGAGRKKGEATLIAQKSRIYLAKRLAKELNPIVSKAIEDAKKGDKAAREWLFDQAFGKAPQAVTLSDDNGDPIAFNVVLDETNLERIAGRVSHGKNTIKA